MVKKSYLAKKDKELKLEVIKNLNPKLYDKVQAGEMELQDAYVQTMMKMKWIFLLNIAWSETMNQELSVWEVH